MTEQATASTPAGGVTAAQLAEAAAGRYGSPRARELERWLLDGGLAEARDGLLYPTPLGLRYATIVAQAAPEGLSRDEAIMHE